MRAMVVLSEMQIRVWLGRRAMPVAASGLKSEWLHLMRLIFARLDEHHYMPH
jgi:hypothetical protein